MPRRRDDFDEDDEAFDDRPRRRPPAGPPVVLIAVLAVGAGLIGLVGLVVLSTFFTPPPPPLPAAPPPAPAVTASPDDPPPAGRQELTVTQVNRLRDRGEVKLQVLYELAGGQEVTGELCVAVRRADGTVSRLPVRNGFRRTEVPGATLPRGSVDLSRGWLDPEFAGELAVWAERGSPPDGGPRISNVFRVRF